jgi:hypothetical protein
MQTNISDIKLKAAKPARKDYRIQIGGNTYLDVLSTGRKVWRMRFNDPTTKKPAIYTFGDYPKIPLRDMGRLAEEVKELVRQGINPTTHRKEEAIRLEREREAAKRADRLSFESVSREWHKHRLEVMQKWKPTHAEKILTSLEADVFPDIGGVHIAKVDAPMLLDVLQKVIDRGAIETARKLNQRISSILS